MRKREKVGLSRLTPRCSLFLFFSLSLSLILSSSLSAQSDRDRAIQRYDSGMVLQSLPLLAKAAAADSTDREVFKRYALALLANSKTLPDTAARRQQRVLARAAMVRAQILGANDSFTANFIRTLPPNGGRDITYSANPLVEEPMQRAEKAFASHDMAGAIAGYREALAIDPSEYQAALFLGDAYAGMESLDSAFASYRRAMLINPYRETAHRYMADVLVTHNRLDEGRDEAIEAILAEPFNRLSRQGLTQWGRAAKIPGGLPLVDLPPRDTAVHSRAAAAYDSVRRDWRGTPGVRSAAFARAYPTDTAYHHGVAEELAGALGEVGQDHPGLGELLVAVR